MPRGDHVVKVARADQPMCRRWGLSLAVQHVQRLETVQHASHAHLDVCGPHTPATGRFGIQAGDAALRRKAQRAPSRNLRMCPHDVGAKL